MELLIILVLGILSMLGLLWLVSPHCWRRRLRVPLAGMAATLVVISPLGVQMGLRLGLWGLTALLPADSGNPVDAIVVLGRGQVLRPLRVSEVWQLWQSKRAPQIFASGMRDARPIVQTLREAGVPKPSLLGEECSQSTQENALFTAAMLGAQGSQGSQGNQEAKEILLVTDPPHLLRSFLVFRSFGFQVIPHASPLPVQMTSKETLLLLLREYAALAKYALTGQFFPRSPASLNPPPAEVTHKIQNWKCKV